MYITAPTLDDLLYDIFEKLLARKRRVVPTRGATTEITGVLLKLSNPRARLSRTEGRAVLFSALGELLWYLAGSRSLKFIEYYVGQRYRENSDDGRTVYGAYGPRLFDHTRGIDQVANVITLLTTKPSSRRAVIQLFDAADIQRAHRDIPCTCTLQFLLRRNRLHMFANMRSNDAFLGLPHDTFAFTMLQEIVARSLNVELGGYKLAVGSLHLYDEHREKAADVLQEGFQVTDAVMPPMPFGDPWTSIRKLLKLEKALRNNKSLTVGDLHQDDYWGDILRLLQIFRYSKDGKAKNIAALKKRMTVTVYHPYIDKRRTMARKKRTPQVLVQKELFGETALASI